MTDSIEAHAPFPRHAAAHRRGELCAAPRGGACRRRRGGGADRERRRDADVIGALVPIIQDGGRRRARRRRHAARRACEGRRRACRAAGCEDLRLAVESLPAEADRRRRQSPFAPRGHGGRRARRRLSLLRPPAWRHARRAASEGARPRRMVVGADANSGRHHGRPLARQRRARRPRPARPSSRCTMRCGRTPADRARRCASRPGDADATRRTAGAHEDGRGLSRFCRLRSRRRRSLSKPMRRRDIDERIDQGLRPDRAWTSRGTAAGSRSASLACARRRRTCRSPLRRGPTRLRTTLDPLDIEQRIDKGLTAAGEEIDVSARLRLSARSSAAGS